MRILIVGDGPRDAIALPALVCAILGCDLDSRFDDIHKIRHLHGIGSARTRKLLYLIRRAKSEKFDGLVVVEDSDKDPARKRLKELQAGRKTDRDSNPLFPTALGEANPHLDVWFLDDEKAIRDGFGLPVDTKVINSQKSDNPRDDVTALHNRSESSELPIAKAIGRVARLLSPSRCLHKKETGLKAFVADLVIEIGVNLDQNEDATRT